MVDFAEHRKALLCNDAASIADYTSAMEQATQAVAAWLQNDKMYTIVTRLRQICKGTLCQ